MMEKIEDAIFNEIFNVLDKYIDSRVDEKIEKTNRINSLTIHNLINRVSKIEDKLSMNIENDTETFKDKAEKEKPREHIIIEKIVDRFADYMYNTSYAHLSDTDKNRIKNDLRICFGKFGFIYLVIDDIGRKIFLYALNPTALIDINDGQLWKYIADGFNYTLCIGKFDFKKMPQIEDIHDGFAMNEYIDNYIDSFFPLEEETVEEETDS